MMEWNGTSSITTRVGSYNSIVPLSMRHLSRFELTMTIALFRLKKKEFATMFHLACLLSCNNLLTLILNSVPKALFITSHIIIHWLLDTLFLSLEWVYTSLHYNGNRVNGALSPPFSFCATFLIISMYAIPIAITITPPVRKKSRPILGNKVIYTKYSLTHWVACSNMFFSSHETVSSFLIDQTISFVYILHSLQPFVYLYTRRILPLHFPYTRLCMCYFQPFQQIFPLLFTWRQKLIL